MYLGVGCVAQHKLIEKLDLISFTAYTEMFFLFCKTELPCLQFLRS